MKPKVGNHLVYYCQLRNALSGMNAKYELKFMNIKYVCANAQYYKLKQFL